MQKKKPTGLSKKVPAIFQGIPQANPRSAGEAQESMPDDRERNPSEEIRSSSEEIRSFAGTVKLLFEVNETSAKVLLVAKHASLWEVKEVRRFPVPSPLPERYQFDWAHFTEWLRATIEEFSIRSLYEVRVLWSGGGIFVAEVDKPQASAKNMREALIWEIAENLPFPVEESQLRFDDKGERVLVMVMENAFLEPLLECFHDAEIYPSVVTALPVAFQALHSHFSLLDSGNNLLVHMTRSRTFILAFRQGRFHSIREFPLGGEHMTKSMMGTLIVDETHVDIGYEEAQVLKETLGLPTPDLMADPEEPKRSQLAARIRPLFEKLTGEFRNMISRFQKQFPEETIDGIYLSGGASEMNGLDDYFSSQMHLPVQKLDVAKMDPKLRLSEVNLTGLAYAPEGRLNFAAAEDLWKPRFELYRERLKKGAFWMGVGFLILALWTGIKIGMSYYEARKHESVFRQMGASNEKIMELDTLLGQIGGIKNIRSREIAPEPPLGRMLRELSQLIPDPIFLKRLDYQKHPKPVAEFRGVIRMSNRSPDVVLSDFLESLNRSPVFQKSQLESRSGETDREKGYVHFVVRTQLMIGRGGQHG